MAWFGDTFGDGLNSIKGQISKITETLTEDPLSTTSFEGQIKELESKCQLYCREIEILKKDNDRFLQAQDTDNFGDQLQNVCQLENELRELKSERDSLRQTIEELDAAHQVELQVLINDRDSLRKEVHNIIPVDKKSTIDGVNNDRLLGDKLLEELKIKNKEIRTLQETLSDAQNLIKANEIVFHERLTAVEKAKVILESELQRALIQVEDSNKTVLICNEEINNLKQSRINEDYVQNECDSLKERITEIEESERNYLKFLYDLHEVLCPTEPQPSNFDSLLRHVTTLIYEKDQLQRTYSELSINSQLSEDLKMKISSLDRINCEKDQKIANLQSTLDKHMEELNEKTSAFLKVEKNYESVVTQVEKLNIDLENNKKLLIDLEKSRQELEEKNKKLTETLSERENVAICQSSPNELRAIEEEAIKLLEILNVPVPTSTDSIEVLKAVGNKVRQVLMEQRERSTTVNDSLRQETEKLMGIVNRIRKDFLRSNGDQDPDRLSEGTLRNIEMQNDENSSEDMLIHSQTDDVKRLKQDVAQMTEIIRMIDDGLTAIYQEKNRVESEIAALQSVSVRTEKELLATIKAKEELEIEKKICEKLLQCKEDELAECLNKVNNLSKQSDEIESLTVQLEEAKRIERLQLENINEITKELAKKEEIISMLQVNNETLNEDESDVVGIKENRKDSAHLQLEQQLARFKEENSDLKMLVQQLRDNIFALNCGKNVVVSDGLMVQEENSSETSNTLESLKSELQQERSRYAILTSQHNSLIEKEANLRREVSRLQQHLVEVEEHYTAEAMVMEQELNTCRAKLIGAEDQLRSSSTVYKSANVRTTQHVESLQSQIRLMSVQRDDLQAKLSTAEDQIQKHTASLASLQMVLEQFQLDKEREIQGLCSKHEYQLKLADKRVLEISSEMSSLKEQLAEAKNGLKAALRLGEQLEKKSQHIVLLEEALKEKENELCDVRTRLKNFNQSSSEKVDKSLVKNLVIGYLTSAQGAHKSQALKILASVLEMSADERNKTGVDDQGSWLSHLLHPKAEASSESLSQAFVRFLESESRPQPQLKLLGEPRKEEPAKKSPTLMSDFVLPSAATGSESTDSVLNSMLEKS